MSGPRDPLGKRWKSLPLPTLDLSEAKCRGKWWLFDSVEIEDHLEARAICATCPALTACHRLMRAETAAYPWGGSGPIGTWAGQLLGTSRHREWRAKRVDKPAHNDVTRGRIEAAQTEECQLPNPGLAPVLRTQNERLTAS